MSTLSALRLVSLATIGLMLNLVATAPAHAQLIEISWDKDGVFERPLTVAPTKFVEVCGKLSKGQLIDWSFSGPQPLDFNIHYHAGKNVVFPEKQDNTASLKGSLNVPVDQDYCWMWESKGSEPAPLTLSLRRR